MQRKQNKYDTWGNNQKLHKSFINTIKPWTLNGDSVAVVLICGSWHSRLNAFSVRCFVFGFSFSRSRTAQVTHAIFGWLQHWRETQNDLRLNLSTTKGWRGGRGRWVGGGGETTNGINSRQTAALQCPPCRWGTSYWWGATGPHTADGRGAYKVGAWPGNTGEDNETLGISFSFKFPNMHYTVRLFYLCFLSLTDVLRREWQPCLWHTDRSGAHLTQPWLPVQGVLMAFCPV